MSVNEFLQSHKLFVENTHKIIPDWMRFLIRLGSYASTTPGIYCCVVVPESPLSSLLVAQGAYIASLENIETKPLSVDQPVYYKNTDGTWLKGIHIESDIPGHIKIRLAGDSNGFVAENDALKRIRPAVWKGDIRSWLHGSLERPIKDSREIERLELDTLRVIADMFGGRAPILAASEHKFITNNSETLALSTWLSLQGTAGVAERAFNVRMNGNGEQRSSLRIYSDKVPEQPSPSIASSVCCLGANNGCLEEKTQEFIQQFIELGMAVKPIQGLPFIEGDGLSAVPRGMAFCGVTYE
jgi:hypothetical protein